MNELVSVLMGVVLVGVTLIAVWLLYRWLNKPKPSGDRRWNPERFEQLQTEDRRRINRRKRTQ